MSPSVRRIAVAVLAEYGLSSDEVENLERACKAAPYLGARQVSAWLARRLHGISFPRLGEEFGGRDHTTMISAVRKVERQVIHGGPLGRVASRVYERLSVPSGAREPTEIDFDACPTTTIELDLSDRPFGCRP